MQQQSLLGMPTVTTAERKNAIRFTEWKRRYAKTAEAEGWTIQRDGDGCYGLASFGERTALKTFSRLGEHVAKAAVEGSVAHRAALAVIDLVELGFIARFTRWDAGVTPDQFAFGDKVQVLGRDAEGNVAWSEATVLEQTDIGYAIRVTTTGSRHECWWNTVRVPVVETPVTENAQ